MRSTPRKRLCRYAAVTLVPELHPALEIGSDAEWGESRRVQTRKPFVLVTTLR